MNTLFLTKEIPYPLNSGHRIRTFHLLKGLSRENNVQVLCFGDNSEAAYEIEKHCASVNLIPDNKAAGKWQLYISALLNVFSITPLSIVCRYSPQLKKRVDEHITRQNPDIVFCDGIHMAPHISSNMKNMILSEHNIESTIIRRYILVEKNIAKKIFAFLEWRKMRHFENKQWQRFSKIFVCSETDKIEVLRRVGQKNIEVIPNGVDIQYYSPRQVDKKPNSLIYSGLMNWRPNEDAVIFFLKKIYPLAKKRIPDISFAIVGKDPSYAITKCAQSDASITITGFVDDVRLYVHASELFIVPLRIGSGTRLKILEAMAMGKAVISTSIGCEGIDVTHERNIIIADTPENFAKGVIRLLNDPVQRDKIAEEGRRMVKEKYSWEIINQRLNKSIMDI